VGLDVVPSMTDLSSHPRSAPKVKLGCSVPKRSATKWQSPLDLLPVGCGPLCS